MPAADVVDGRLLRAAPRPSSQCTDCVSRADPPSVVRPVPTASAGRPRRPAPQRGSARPVGGFHGHFGDGLRLVGASLHTALPTARAFDFARMPSRHRLLADMVQLQCLLALHAHDEFRLITERSAFDAGQNLRHRCLRNPELRRDMALRHALQVPFNRVHFTLTHAAHRFSTPTTASTATRTARHRLLRCGRFTRATLTARRPEKACHRSIAACTYVGSISMAKHRRPVFSAAISAVPDPANKSSSASSRVV